MRLVLVDDKGLHEVVIENVEECDLSLASPYKLANIGIAVKRAIRRIHNLPCPSDEMPKGG